MIMERGNWAMSARECDSCKSAAALLFCRADSAFLCSACDSRVHGANRLASRHERVWMCEVCEHAPAAVTCKADAAALCVSCDADIHSANPLARRHERVPVVPFFESAATAALLKNHHHAPPAVDDDEEEGEAETVSWLLPKSAAPEMKPAEYFFSDVDPYLDLEFATSMDANKYQLNNPAADSVVPVQAPVKKPPPPMAAATVLVPPPLFPHSDNNCFDFIGSKPCYSTYTPSLSQSVSSSEVGVVPDGIQDITNPYGKAAAQLTGMDREAKVLRYREKRKNRRFEKTIRYASRKAYAETRPRIKGRFAKRTEIEAEDVVAVDRMFSSSVVSPTYMIDPGYGVVPSF